MEKKEKRPSYFARLRKRRQLKVSDSETHPDPTVICEPTPAGQNQDSLPNGKAVSEGSMNGDSETHCKPNVQHKREKRKPPGTVEYTVGSKDTLNSIALKFNINPTNLMQLNRLFSHSVVPGQKLFVPDMGQAETSSPATVSSDSVNTAPSETQTQEDKASWRRRYRELSPPSEDESPARFLKMSCKYFTDGMGVVGGVMIVTPNNIMFDPHKSDPLVIEHGCEEYGLICPMEDVMSVALYDDVSRMKLKDALPSDIPQDLCPLYRPGEWEELPSEQDLNPFSRFEALSPTNRPIVLDELETAGSEDRECHPADNSPSDEGFTELDLLQIDPGNDQPVLENKSIYSSPTTLQGATTQQVQIAEEAQVRAQRCQNGLCEDEDEGLNHSTEENTEPVLDPATGLISNEKKETEGLSPNPTNDASQIARDQNTVESESHKEEQETTTGPSLVAEPGLKVEEERSSEAEMKSWLLKRMQGPIEDMLLSTEEKSKKPPMFLCFKVGKPMRKSFSLGRTSSPAHLFLSRGKQPEYWFAVPQERVDHLYSFFIQWSPDAYGKDAQDQGFVVVEKDELNVIDNFFSDPVPRNWEIITMNEARRRQSFGSFEEDEPLDPLSVLIEPSTLLEDTHVEKLVARLPARVQGYPWRLAYSTVRHGTSLKTLYRNLCELDCPVLMVIKDMDNRVFGVFSTHPFKVSEHYYGTGETFMYTFSPEIKVFRWTGENSYFVKGNLDSLQIGGGGGHMGLWLDADLFHGTTSRCSTFNNQPLSSQQDFSVQDLEVWAFE